MRPCALFRPAAALLLAGTLQACTVVGYPSGSPAPAGAGAPERTAGSVRVAGPVAADPGARPSDAGRTYEIFGVEYQVLHTAEGYVEEGMASWYGDEFHGRPTASGEKFDKNGFTAAHRTLPLHTWVEVTNLENGRALILRVNDRGPFARTHQRILDLSFGAARDLGVVGPGTARVRVRALSGEEVARLR
ncbi:MAG: septal ring lytic transglycosylase RlpA family protein [Longimicrobiales bacterium]|nr:septal ring lytic transglycosylase RlpA family protein [Longimicrobiales bacterium]